MKTMIRVAPARRQHRHKKGARQVERSEVKLPHQRVTVSRGVASREERPVSVKDKARSCHADKVQFLLEPNRRECQVGFPAILF